MRSRSAKWIIAFESYPCQNGYVFGTAFVYINIILVSTLINITFKHIGMYIITTYLFNKSKLSINFI